MSDPTVCKSCGARLERPGAPAGSAFPCPQCDEPVTVPEKVKEKASRPARKKTRKKRGGGLWPKVRSAAGLLLVMAALSGGAAFLAFNVGRVDPKVVTFENYNRIAINMSAREVRAFLGSGARSTDEAVRDSERYRVSQWRLWQAGDRSILVGYCGEDVVYKQWRDGADGEYAGVITTSKSLEQLIKDGSQTVRETYVHGTLRDETSPE